MSLEQNRAFVQGFFAAIDRGGMDQLETWLAPGFVAHIVGAPDPLDLEAYQQFGGMFYAAFPDGGHEFEEVLAEGDKVVTRGTFSGTHQGELMGIPRTDKRVTMAVWHVDRLAGGKIAEHWGLADFHGLMQQLGAGPGSE